jgi:hypothetical protein
MDPPRTWDGISIRIHSPWIRTVPFSRRKLCLGAHKNFAPNESRKENKVSKTKMMGTDLNQNPFSSA